LLEIVLSTAHKAKGLEFPLVVLSDDFLPRANDATLDDLLPEEHRENLNILYVAVTRATKELILNADLFYLLYKMCRVSARSMLQIGKRVIDRTEGTILSALLLVER
jgi:superfamily I DNA/RNA helicase